MHDQRDVRSGHRQAGGAICLRYCVPILAIVVVLPAERITGTPARRDALVRRDGHVAVLSAFRHCRR